MTSQKLQFSRALQRLVDAVERLSEDDFSKLGDESFNIEIRLTRKRSKEGSSTPTHDADLANVIEKLTAFRTEKRRSSFLMRTSPHGNLLSQSHASSTSQFQSKTRSKLCVTKSLRLPSVLVFVRRQSKVARSNTTVHRTLRDKAAQRR